MIKTLCQYWCLFALLSCGSNSSWYQEKSVEGWHWNEKLEFELNTLPEVNLSAEIVIKHKPDYKYQNVYLTIESSSYSDTISVRLAENNGTWKGRCTNEECELISSLNLGANQLEKNWKVTVGQYSRDEVLIGINKIGIRISKTAH